MEKQHNVLLIFFATVALVSLAGFFNSYWRHFPDLHAFPILIHIHFTAFLLWLGILVVQPLLIRQRKYRVHAAIGKASYALAPVLVLTMALLMHQQVSKEIGVSLTQAATTAFIGVIDVVSFSSYYLLAMVYRRRTRWHVAFLIASTLVVLNPGLSRLLNPIQYGLGIVAAVFLPFVLSLAALAFEKIKYKRPLLKSPYLLYLALWTLTMVLFMTVPQTQMWLQAVAKRF